MHGLGLEFDWDEANRNHLARHDVTPQEAEEVVLGDPLDIELQTAEGGGEERVLHVGRHAKDGSGARVNVASGEGSGHLRVGCASAIQTGLSGRDEAAVMVTLTNSAVGESKPTRPIGPREPREAVGCASPSIATRPSAPGPAETAHRRHPAPPPSAWPLKLSARAPYFGRAPRNALPDLPQDADPRGPAARGNWLC